MAADDGVRALAERIVDVRGDLVEALPVDERAHLRLIAHRIADAKLAHAVGHLLGERRLNPVVHVDAVGAHAGLTGVAELRRHHLLHRRRDIRIVANDERRVAAELERHALHGARRLFVQLDADLGAAGEGELAHPRIVEEHVGERGRDRTWSRTWNTSAGPPAFTHNSSSRIAVSGDCSAGLSTTVHPAASAGATLRVTIAAGKFHGVTA